MLLIVGISLNPTDFLKLFADHKKADREKIAVWLDKAAADARKIADIWVQNRDIAISAEHDYEEKMKSGDGYLHIPYIPLSQRIANTYDFSSLSDSRKNFSLVIDGRTSRDITDAFANKSSAVIVRRNLIKQLYESLFGKNSPRLILLDDTNREEQIEKLDSSVDLLIKEAAALETLARNFRASRSL